ncbi:MAG: Rpn family recombination-promoting nuclease/putative transposase [Bacteroidales bacterium]|nr:Rpn family recombination-promoting nuclease/putative transposase [Bacteroidales bacterium]
MMDEKRLIRFDWAAKRMLRDKANFGVLEGLITVLLDEPVHIVEILDGESNQDDPNDKFNRVDIKAKNSKDEIIIVEIQQTRELYYLERILYGVSKAITEHIELGDKYDHVKKVYSINILYFDLGKGTDYLYHGTTTFKGVHTGDVLEITTKDKDAINMKTPKEIFPEYYLIRVNEFNSVAKTPLEEWLDYLKNDHIKENTTTPGLQEVRKKLQYLSMNSEDRKAYDRHIDNIMYQNGVFDAAHLEGIVEGRMIERLQMVKNLKEIGVSVKDIAKATGLSEQEIMEL